MISLLLILTTLSGAQETPAAGEPITSISTNTLRFEAVDLPTLTPIVYVDVLDENDEMIPVDSLPLTAMPQVIEYIQAPYPEAAQADQLEGTVSLLIELDEWGRLISAEVSSPIGHGFDEAALQATRQMTFSPAQTEAGPVGVVFEFAYGFVFTPEEPEAPVVLPVNLDGKLTEMGTRVPVSDATIAIDRGELSTRTDERGHFELRGVPNGSHSLRVLSPEHVQFERTIQIVDGEVTELSLWIRSNQYRSNEAVGVYQTKREEVTRRTIQIDEIKRIPGTFGDPIKVIQTLPGAARSPFGTGLLIIRGSNPEDSGVYVDGVRMPIIYHLTGTTSVLSPDLVESVDYLPGGFGGQYGRSMAGVVDVKTKTHFAKNGKIVWGTDILDSQLYYEGQLGKNKDHGIAFGARRSYIDVIIPLVTKGTGFNIKPRYWDYSVKYLHRGKKDQLFSLFLYGYNDVLTVSTPANIAQGSDQDTQGDLFVEYKTHRLIGHYEGPLTRTVALTVTPSLGFDVNSTSVFGSVRLNNDIGTVAFRLETPWTPSPHFKLIPGIDLLGGPWKFDASFPFSFDEIGDPLAERNPMTLTGSGWYWSPDIYAKAVVNPLSEPDSLMMTLSARMNTAYNRYSGSVSDGTATWTALSFDPRLALRSKLSPKSWVKGATGLYSQPPMPFESVGIGTDVVLGFERAWNTSVGFEHQLTQAVQWDVDFFYRDMSNLVVENPAFNTFGDPNFINAGLGRAYGTELILRHLPANHFFGWISYTLSKSERKNSVTDDWVPFDFDQTHILSAQGGYDLPFNMGVSAQIQWVTGNPSSPFNSGIYDVDTDSYTGFRIGDRNSVRLPDYVQTSVRFDKTFTFRTWKLATYLDLMNAVRGINPEFTRYNYDYTEFAYVRGLPFIPNLGIEATFTP